ncbi:MAG: ABC transporter permease [Tenuifilaceae bacterium]|jgi:ABC-type antimicrobial peptide transport system permease subunit|nr:ABC transporter permease [Tenuifilaceae bacterium]
MISQTKYAIKSLIKNKVYTLINIGGLALGLSVTIALSIFVIGFASLDQFHENEAVVYKLISNEDSTTNHYNDAASVLLAPAVMEAFPEVVDYCQYLWANDVILGSIENHVKENGFYADAGWFRMLSYPLIYGDANHVLSDPNNIVISQKVSQKLFGNSNPLGETIKMFSHGDIKPEVFIISGVFEDGPAFSSHQFEFVIPFSWHIMSNEWMNSWTSIGTRAYIQVAPNTNIQNLSTKITELVRDRDQYMRETQVFGLAPLNRSNNVIYSLTGEPSFGFYIISAMVIVGLSILTISVINYVNLSVATSLKRSKEIGVKKINGASRNDLIIQFFIESFLVVMLAGGLSLLMQPYLMEIFLPNQTIFTLSFDPTFVLVLIGLLAFTIAITTWYPAVYMSRLAPIAIQKFAVGGSFKLSFWRKFLVIIQFVSAILLITTSIILSQQVDFLLNQSLGMDRYNLVFFDKTYGIDNRMDAFTQELKREKGVESITFANQLPYEIGMSTTSISWEGKDPSDNEWYSTLFAGEGFATTMRIDILQGQDFTAEIQNKVLVNKAAAERMQMENPVGTIVSVYGEDREVVGVVDNFKFQMMGESNSPLFIVYEPDNSNMVIVRLEEGNQVLGLEALRRVFNQFSPEFVLDYSFLDQVFDKQFAQLKSMGNIMTVAGYLAIVIACMGLLGLTVHTSERRVKELGVRKINGARVSDLILLLSKQIARSILIASALAFPLGYMLNKTILQNFAERISLSPMHFMWALLILVALTSFIVGWHIVWAARRNPVEALRYE